MISIVIAYYNRKKVLYNTLQSIKKSVQKNYELILVDDGSDEEERVEDLIFEFPFMRVIHIEKKDKWYMNSCIPYNIGIAAAKGDIIIIQNPECIHVGDVLTYIVENITDDNYLSISTYAFGEFEEKSVFDLISNFDSLPQKRYGNENTPRRKRKQGKLSQRTYEYENMLGWYNHPIYRPVYYHFCGVLTRKNMDALGGFDERFANGVAYEDDEFVERITRLGLKKEIPLEVSVLHQWHEKVFHLTNINKIKKNEILYKLLTLKETSIFKSNSYRKPKVTIIIPYKDDRGWLQEAIDSVPDWCQLIISQGEGDWAENFNKVLPEVTGDYIKFLHEDDILSEDSLTVAVDAIVQQDVDFIHGNAIEIDKNGNHGNRYIPPEVVSYKNLLKSNPIHGGTVLYKKEIFDLLKGFDERLHHSEEYEFNLRCLWAGFKLGYCDEILYYYRRHSNTKSVKIRSNLSKLVKELMDTHLKERDTYARL